MGDKPGRADRLDRSDRPVVVGTDGSPAACAAVDWAADEAAARGLPLRVVHAAVWAHFESAGRPLADRVTQEAGVRARSRRPSGAVVTEVLLRDPVPALLDEGESAALLVLGSRALGPVAGALLGSVSLPVMGRAPCPVVVVRDVPPLAGAGRPVVLGVGEHGEAVAAAAFALASAVARGCAVRAVHAWRPPPSRRASRTPDSRRAPSGTRAVRRPESAWTR
ncbi:universal stress protein [Streptomyces sp. TS71-3]|uniref:universal stress protein n=1 Tax=Streptomyces sp. TS71-3 TaxID=2733862 RepID=UPI001B2F8254|nr:universal stress protein [Streptomyces sp. TS71-3]GHJ36896.1 hypothetical protein Sm713_25050 [Streptomyces sp. TS71-3]